MQSELQEAVVKTFLIILLGILLVIGMGFLLLNFYNTFYAVENYFVKAGIIVIFIFTLLVILRYMSLLFFSIFKILFKQNNAVENRVMDTQRKVTIIVPAFNEEKTIGKTIESLKEQTYPNLEIIVVDDGSTDRTFSTAKLYEFYETNRSLRVLKKTNGGKASAINYGI
ncbi:MAG: glycosyltransferase family 2 protein, partial [Epsilonproteobacteria bacterium]|nr:glycosyltransferase family 2 protein [Campylobacterota bacterium]